MAHVGVSLDDDEKQRWADYVEESGHGSISELVRTAVRKEIQREGDDGAEIPRELEQDLSRVAETQQRLQSQMAELAEGFDAVEEVATEDAYREEIKGLGHRIAEHLEELPEDRFGDLESEVQDELVALGREVSDTEEKVPYPPGEVGRALEYLEQNLSYIESVPKSPADYYRIDYRTRGGSE